MWAPLYCGPRFIPPPAHLGIVYVYVLTLLELERAEVTEGWRKLHNKELHNLYSSTYIIRVIKSRKMVDDRILLK
jgi:hypothetical protein